MPNPELIRAFAAALEATRHARAANMTCIDGRSADANLAQLERELLAEQERSSSRETVDSEWFQKTVRWLVEWVPETDLTLIAALGRIVRAKPS